MEEANVNRGSILVAAALGAARARPEIITAAGYSFAQTLEQVLRHCGDNLTRENIMKQAANLWDFRVGLLLPDSRINTLATDYRVVTCMVRGASRDQFG